MTTYVVSKDTDRDRLEQLRSSIDAKTIALGHLIETCIKNSYNEQFNIFYREPSEVSAQSALLFTYRMINDVVKSIDDILNEEQNVFLKIEKLNEYNKSLNNNVQRSYRLLVNEFKNYGIELQDMYKDIDGLPF